MLDMGFKADMEKIIGAAPSQRQTLMFSATLDDTAERLARRILKQPVRVEIDGRLVTHDKIEQKMFVADDVKHKIKLLKHLVEQPGVKRTIIFSATKRGADRLARDLKRDGHRAEALHGDMSQNARNRAVTNLRQGHTKLLVATDVAARGLDVSGISHVINFNLPQVSEDYVHRIGRTGRAGASGIAISLIGDDLDIERLVEVQRYLGKEIPRDEIAGMEPTRKICTQPKQKSTKRPHGSGPKRRNWKKKPGNRNRNSRPEVVQRKSKAGKNG
jgi:superfamily II DNA/RNA helicase